MPEQQRDDKKVPQGIPVEQLRLSWWLMVAGCALGAWATSSKTPVSMAVGAAFLIPGVLLALAAVRTLGHPQAVVSQGPYRWVRHPYLLAVLLLLVGMIVALRAWPAIVLLLPTARLTVQRARREEHNLRLRYPEEYEAYSRRVPFLLPLAPPLPPEGLPGLKPKKGLLAELDEENSDPGREQPGGTT